METIHLKKQLYSLVQRAEGEKDREYLLGYGQEILDILREMQMVFEQNNDLDVGYLKALRRGLGYILTSYESIMMSKLADDIADFLNDIDSTIENHHI